MLDFRDPSYMHRYHGASSFASCSSFIFCALGSSVTVCTAYVSWLTLLVCCVSLFPLFLLFAFFRQLVIFLLLVSSDSFAMRFRSVHNSGSSILRSIGFARVMCQFMTLRAFLVVSFYVCFFLIFFYVLSCSFILLSFTLSAYMLPFFVVDYTWYDLQHLIRF